MKKIFLIFLMTALVVSGGCEFKKNISRDEIPIIKKALADFEVVLKSRDTARIDSLLFSEAEESGTTAEGVLRFVYGGGVTDFAGFQNKRIFFRGDAARIDCKIAGLDGALKEVTITMRKEDDIWKVKKIENKTDEAIKEDGG